MQKIIQWLLRFPLVLKIPVYLLFAPCHHPTKSYEESMEALKEQIKEFIQARDWEQYHAPKNLALALNVEEAEILEIFQWKENQEDLTETEIESLKQEIGDVLVYLLELADKYQIDIVQAAKDKMILNEAKYPADKVKGKAWKYSDYE